MSTEKQKSFEIGRAVALLGEAATKDDGGEEFYEAIGRVATAVSAVYPEFDALAFATGGNSIYRDN